MKTFPTDLPGVIRIELEKHSDDRGYFVERYRADWFRDLPGHADFVQDNFSRSLPRVVRGLHFQVAPAAQGKLVGVTAGKIFDVAVDIRPDSPTFRKWVGFELSAENQELLWIPAGYAHGFLVLGDEPADVFYKVDRYFAPDGDRGIRFDDPELGIRWPGAGPYTVSAKDRALPTLSEYLRRNRP